MKEKGNPYPGNCYYCKNNMKPGEMATIPKDWPGVWAGDRGDPLAHVQCDKFPKKSKIVLRKGGSGNALRC